MFLGIGLKRAVAMAIFVGLFWVFGKVILNKYPVKGLTDVANAV